jgi:hypothetical protein
MDGAAGEATEDMPEWAVWLRGMSGDASAELRDLAQLSEDVRWACREWASMQVGVDVRAEDAAARPAAAANAAVVERISAGERS